MKEESGQSCSLEQKVAKKTSHEAQGQSRWCIKSRQGARSHGGLGDVEERM
jgi:hypothetical protein